MYKSNTQPEIAILMSVDTSPVPFIYWFDGGRVHAMVASDTGERAVRVRAR